MTSLRALRRFGLVAAVAVAWSLVGVGTPAGAASTTIGQLGADTPCEASIDAVQNSVVSGTSYTVPPGLWNVTSWSTRAQLGPSTASLQLEIWRPTGTTNEYLLVGISPVGTTSASGTNTFPLATPIEVQGGDLLGLRNLTFLYGCVILGGGSVNAGVAGTEPVAGETRTIPPVRDALLNIAATLDEIPPTLQVEKVVSGTSSSGFVEQVQCTVPAEALASTTVVDVTLPFQADGTPDSTSAPTGWMVSDGTWQLEDTALVGATCTVTETDTGGATSVSYSCSWTAGTSDHLVGVGCPGASSGPSEEPASVLFEGDGDVGVLTVTNTFVPPPVEPPPVEPPIVEPPIVIGPKFTG